MPASTRPHLRSLKRVLLAVAVGAAITTTPAAPASAASGGGCTTVHDVRPCVSYSREHARVSADFYLVSRRVNSCWARIYMIVNGTWHHKASFELTHLGRYGEVHHDVAGANGTAYTAVQLHRCVTGAFQYTAVSPTLFYP